MTDWKAKLKALGPCSEAYKWACQFKTLREAWRMCEDGSWMEWLLHMCGERDIEEALMDTRTCGWKEYPGAPLVELFLQDAYICLDFMPNPPRLPEIQG